MSVKSIRDTKEMACKMRKSCLMDRGNALALNSKLAYLLLRSHFPINFHNSSQEYLSTVSANYYEPDNTLSLVRFFFFFFSPSFSSSIIRQQLNVLGYRLPAEGEEQAVLRVVVRESMTLSLLTGLFKEICTITHVLLDSATKIGDRGCCGNPATEKEVDFHEWQSIDHHGFERLCD